MMYDLYGNSVSTQSPAALAKFDTACELIRLYVGDPIAALDAAIEEDPDFGMAWAMRAGILVQQTDKAYAAEVERSIRAAAKGKLDARERAHLAAALIVWGDRDVYCPHTDQSALCEALGAELVVMAGVGHAVHWERPTEVAKELVNFVAGLEQPPLAGAQSPGRRVLLGSVQ